MPKKKKSVPKKESRNLIKTAWLLSFIALALIGFVAGYYMGYDEGKDEIIKKERQKEQKRVSMLAKLEEGTKKSDTPSINDRLKEVLKKEPKPTDSLRSEEYQDASHEVEGTILPKPPEHIVKKTFLKPKLAIIIDDVSVRSHVESIKRLNLPITMSFLPPSKFRPNSHTLAAKEKFYMVHLPMEAKNFTKEEPFTLKVDDSQEVISQRISEIKKLFPRVAYINNHTGSKFTSDEQAVGKLIYALDKNNINFIDSRTIASTKVPQVMKSYGKEYISRDIFLDHEFDKGYVKEQIKKAVEFAKAHGSAIAIGHPHANTIAAIEESKGLLCEVELVLVEGLY